MRLAAGFAATGVLSGGLAACGQATAAPAGAGVASAACRAPVGRAVVRTGQASDRTSASWRAPAAVIRVDQVGYPSGAPKHAEIMATSRRAGLAWELIRRRSCAVVAHGTATNDLGSWSSRYPAVWAVSFTRVRGPGTYRLALTARPSIVSPWFRIGPSRLLYAHPTANALTFYQNERDGPDFIPSGLRTAPGHLNDARAMTFRSPTVGPNGNFKGSLRRYATGVRINAT